jgi:hypothetical protein
MISIESLVLASCLSADDPKKVLVCGLKMYKQLDGEQCVDCYVSQKYERIWTMLMEFSDTDLKRVEDCGCESNKWWPVYHTIAVCISCLLDC